MVNTDPSYDVQAGYATRAIESLMDHEGRSTDPRGAMWPEIAQVHATLALAAAIRELADATLIAKAPTPEAVDDPRPPCPRCGHPGHGRRICGGSATGFCPCDGVEHEG